MKAITIRTICPEAKARIEERAVFRHRTVEGEAAASLGDQEARGSRWRQGGIYFGDDDICATDRVRATMDVDALFPWVEPSVRDIRMLQITEEDPPMDFLGYEAGRSARGGRKR